MDEKDLEKIPEPEAASATEAQAEAAPQDGPKEPVQYAPPMKRLWAWVGVVYMVILTLLNVYGLAHGYFLTGIGPLMVTPALVGLGCAAILRFREGKGRGGLAACVLVSGGCFALSVWNLVRAVPVLLAQLVG